LETVAVYSENKVKTYGFRIEGELVLYRLTMAPHEMDGLGSLFYNETNGIRFTWVLVQKRASERLEIYLLVNQLWLPSVSALLERSRADGIAFQRQATSGVALISFHGPHFGDRYGIADTALVTLDNRNVPILVSGCSSASVYIVVPDRHAKETADILAEVFETP